MERIKLESMMNKCLICNAKCLPFISFGRMPIANGFLKPSEYAKEYWYELKVGFCRKCFMVQLCELVDREKMFHENYAFYSSTSQRMQVHFKEFAQNVLESKFLKGIADPFVAEIGSNDGIMLKHFAKRGLRHIGFEPSRNVAEVAIQNGIHTLVEFFDETLAKKIVKKEGNADVFLGANVMCHIPYMHSVMEGIKYLLKPKGVLIFEDPYIGDIIQKTSYDQIYDEHAFYFSVSSVDYLAKLHGMEVIDAQHQDVHGGSMRYTVAKKGVYTLSSSVKKILQAEVKMGLHQVSTYKKFASHVNKSKKDLIQLLTSLKKKGKRVVGYGATSKSTTITNFCSITPDLVECIYDTTPIKIGKFSPGVHIPVRSYSEFAQKYPDYALLFAWNHKKEILEKEKPYLLKGGKFILFVSSIHLVDKKYFLKQTH